MPDSNLVIITTVMLGGGAIQPITGLSRSPGGVCLRLFSTVCGLFFDALGFDHGEFMSAIDQNVIRNQLFAATTADPNMHLGDFERGVNR